MQILNKICSYSTSKKQTHQAVYLKQINNSGIYDAQCIFANAPEYLQNEVERSHFIGPAWW